MPSVVVVAVVLVGMISVRTVIVAISGTLFHLKGDRNLARAFEDKRGRKLITGDKG